MYCFAKICRLCMTHDGDLIHCRTRDKNNIPIYHKIKVIFPQMISKQSHHFPIWICSKCQEQLNYSYEFKQKCYNTYKLLKKYSTQLYAANKKQIIPDLPSGVFQQVKPIIDSAVILIDEEETDNHCNVEDITIVKHELLPNNFKNEPEFNTMIQKIIDSNFETIRELRDTRGSLVLKQEFNNITESCPSIKHVSPEQELHTDHFETRSQCDVAKIPFVVKQELINISESCPSINKQISPEQEVHSDSIHTAITPDFIPDNQIAVINNSNGNILEELTTNHLDLSTFTLDYTNASFETFASHVAPSITVNQDNLKELNVDYNSLTKNNLNISSRPLRRRKPISYKYMDAPPVAVKKVAKRNTFPTKKKNSKKTMSLQPKPDNKKAKNIKSISSKSLSCLDTLVSHIHKKHLDKSRGKIKFQPSRLDVEPMSEELKEYKKKYGFFYCEKCSKQYVTYSRFRLHSSKCQGSILYPCVLCEKNFTQLRYLRRHSKRHSAVLLNCSLCAKQYKSSSSLERHRRAKHFKPNTTNASSKS